MKKEKIKRIILLGIGLLSINICFFTNIAELGDDSGKFACDITYAGSFNCNYLGAKAQLLPETFKDDDFSNTIQNIWKYGGFSLGVGIIVILIISFEKQIGLLLTQIITLVLLGIGIVLCLMNPIMKFEYRPPYCDLKVFPLFLEFTAVISYCGAWELTYKAFKNKVETTLC